MSRLPSLIFAALLLAPAASLHAAGLTNLRCEYRENPLGIDVPKPRLSWGIANPQSEISNLKSQITRSVVQTAYQVLVASIRKATYGAADGGGGAVMKLQASLVEPSRRIQELKVVKVNEPRPGCWTFDLGQNMVGCSSAALNQLYSNIIWGQKGNYLEVPTDCPQRDERMGWTGDTQFFAPTGAYNFDVAAFFTRWLTTCEDNQYADGTFPHVVPDIMGGGGSTAWGDAALLCTYNVYRAYGDTRIVADRFAALERYMQWLATKTSNGISSVGGFGDWLNAGGSAKTEVIDTAYHAYLAQIMSEMARAIGRKDDAARYAKRHKEVKAAFVREFLQADGSLKECSQTGYALAFSMNLLPADMREKAAAKFVDEIKRFGWHLATGMTEGGNILVKVKGVKFLRMENNAAVYAVGSGTYQFQSALTKTVK